MKEIIRKPIYYKTVCNKCGCEFSYQCKDIEFDTFIDCFVVECPNCKYNNDHRQSASVYKEKK